MLSDLREMDTFMVSIKLVTHSSKADQVSLWSLSTLLPQWLFNCLFCTCLVLGNFYELKLLSSIFCRCLDPYANIPILMKTTRNRFLFVLFVKCCCKNESPNYAFYIRELSDKLGKLGVVLWAHMSLILVLVRKTVNAY